MAKTRAGLALKLVTAYSGLTAQVRFILMPNIADLSDITLDEAIRTLAVNEFQLMDIHQAADYHSDIDDPLIFQAEDGDLVFCLDSLGNDDPSGYGADSLKIIHVSLPYPVVGKFIFGVESDIDGVTLNDALRILAGRLFGPFDENDWQGYSGVGSTDPLICHEGSMTYILGSSEPGAQCLDTLEILTLLDDETALEFGDSHISRTIVLKKAEFEYA